MWVKKQGQKDAANPAKERYGTKGPQVYSKTDAHVITPDRGPENAIVVPMMDGDHHLTSKEFKDRVEQILQPWSKDALLQQKKFQGELRIPELLQSPIRNAGEGLTWQHYDFGFNPDEIADPVKKQAAFEAVRDWAGNSPISGQRGPRAAIVYDWHEDGAKPHIRVAVQFLPWLHVEGHDDPKKNVPRPSLVQVDHKTYVKGQTNGGVTLDKGSNENEEMLDLAKRLAPLGIGVYALNRDVSAEAVVQALGPGGVVPPAGTGVSAEVDPLQDPATAPAPSGRAGSVPRPGATPTKTGLDQIEAMQIARLREAELTVQVIRDGLEQTQLAKQALIDRTAAIEERDLAQEQQRVLEEANRGLTTTNTVLGEELTATKQKLETTSTDLQTALDALREATEKLNQAGNDIHRLNTEKATETARADTAQNALATATAANAALTESNEALRRDLEAAKNDRHVAEEQARALSDGNATLKDLNRNLTEANATLKQENERLVPIAAQAEVAKGEVNTLKRELETAQGQVRSLSENNSTLKDLNRNLAEANIGLKQENERLVPIAAQVDAAKGEVETLKRELEAAQRERAELDAALAAVKDKNAALEREVAPLRHQKDLLKAVLDEVEQRNAGGQLVEENLPVRKSMYYGMVMAIDKMAADDPTAASDPALVRMRPRLIERLEKLDREGVLTLREREEIEATAGTENMILRQADIMMPRTTVPAHLVERGLSNGTIKRQQVVGVNGQLVPYVEETEGQATASKPTKGAETKKPEGPGSGGRRGGPTMGRNRNSGDIE